MLSSVNAVKSSADSGTKTSQPTTATQITSSRCERRSLASQPNGEPASEGMLGLAKLNCGHSRGSGGEQCVSNTLSRPEQILEELQPLLFFFAGELNKNDFLGFQPREGVRRVRRDIRSHRQPPSARKHLLRLFAQE